MDRTNLMKVLSVLQNAGIITSSIGESGDSHLSLSCLMAPYRHEGGMDETPSMTVSVDDTSPSIARCHMCQYRANLYNAVMDLNVLHRGAFRNLAEWVREVDAALKKLETVEVKEKKEKPLSIINYSSELRKYLADGLPPGALEFLASKGIPEQTARFMNFAWIEKAAIKKYDKTEVEVRDSILIPVMSRVSGNLICVGAQARPLTRKATSSKYFTFFKFKAGHFLYAEHLLDRAAGNPLFVLEGPLDVAHFASIGVHAVGLFGLYINQPRMAKIIHSQPRIVFVMLDPDPEGQKRVERIVMKIHNAGLMVAPIVPTKDPKYLTREDLTALTGGVI